jgi:hypothetical protein
MPEQEISGVAAGLRYFGICQIFLFLSKTTYLLPEIIITQIIILYLQRIAGGQGLFRGVRVCQ